MTKPARVCDCSSPFGNGDMLDRARLFNRQVGGHLIDPGRLLSAPLLRSTFCRWSKQENLHGRERSLRDMAAELEPPANLTSAGTRYGAAEVGL
jgi:hypothetical protein